MQRIKTRLEIWKFWGLKGRIGKIGCNYTVYELSEVLFEIIHTTDQQC